MHEALLYKPLKNRVVQCNLCNWHCTIQEGKAGVCKIRKNEGGKLYSLVYGKPCSIAIDPVEKKPLFHFFPRSPILSFGTFGCNLFCMGCQNFDISKGDIDKHDFEYVSPEEMIEIAKEKNCKLIAFTYNEPTMFFEYMLDVAKLAKKNSIKTVAVSNGYMSKEALDVLLPYLDAVNIDVKGFTESFYRNYCKTKLQPVLDNLLYMKGKTWIELTNLIIPGLNDNLEDIEKMCVWIEKNLGKDVPLHFSRFFPMYKAEDKEITPMKTLEKAREIAIKHVHYVYVGNIRTDKYENTHCPKCKKLLIKRIGYHVMENHIEKNKCGYCKEKVEGVWG